MKKIRKAILECGISEEDCEYQIITDESIIHQIIIYSHEEEWEQGEDFWFVEDRSGYAFLVAYKHYEEVCIVINDYLGGLDNVK